MPIRSAKRGRVQRDMGGEKISEQVIGGTQRHFLTVAASRPWRGSQGSAAPGLPGRLQGYPNREGVSTTRWDVVTHQELKT